MRIRYRHPVKLGIQKVAATIAFLIPVTIFASLGGTISYLFNEIPSFGTSNSLKPDPSTFIPANYTLLSDMAQFYDTRYNSDHIPLNYTVGTIFTNASCTTVSYYDFTDNGALWTGTAMAAYVGKYLAAVREGNSTLKADALLVLQKLVNGTAMMLAVPNGGLGPGFGATVARAWASPQELRNVPGVGYLLDTNDKFYNGSGIYSQYRYSDQTSNDEYGGFYMGLALTYRFVPDPSIQPTLKLMIDQVCSGMLKANFLGIGGFGGPTGVDQKMKFFQGAQWQLLILKMGALAFPEKYASIY